MAFASIANPAFSVNAERRGGWCFRAKESIRITGAPPGAGKLRFSLRLALRVRHLPILMPSPSSHPRDPLHGVTLDTVLRQLVARHGWEEMGWRIPIRCFLVDPSVKSSLAFLRKTPWARKKVEAWFAEESSDPPAESGPTGGS